MHASHRGALPCLAFVGPMHVAISTGHSYAMSAELSRTVRDDTRLVFRYRRLSSPAKEHYWPYGVAPTGLATLRGLRREAYRDQSSPSNHVAERMLVES